MSKKNYDKSGISTHHSFIQLSNGCVRKIIEPQSSFSTLEQEALIKDILEFRRRLQVAGVPVASEYKLEVKDGAIVEETVNCGIDGFKALKANSGLSAKSILTQIVRAIRPILFESEITLSPDPHPANWCFDTDGVGRYIDFQPARFKREDGLKIVGFPQPTGKEYEWSVGRYYSRVGLVRILRFNAMRAGGPKIRDVLTDIMRNEWPELLFNEVSVELDTLLEEQVRRGEFSIDKALESCDEWNVDDIRELAMIVAERKTSNSAYFLDQVLEYTRADFNIPIITRRLGVEKAKTLVMQNV